MGEGSHRRTAFSFGLPKWARPISCSPGSSCLSRQAGPGRSWPAAPPGPMLTFSVTFSSWALSFPRAARRAWAGGRVSFHFVPVALGSWEGPGGDLGSSGEGRLLAGRVSLRDPLPTLPQFQKLGVLVLSNSSIRDWGGSSHCFIYRELPTCESWLGTQAGWFLPGSAPCDTGAGRVSVDSVPRGVPLGWVFFWLCRGARSGRPRRGVRALRQTRGAWPWCEWKLGQSGKQTSFPGEGGPLSAGRGPNKEGPVMITKTLVIFSFGTPALIGRSALSTFTPGSA